MYRSLTEAETGRRGWRYPGNGRRRWLEPFVLLLVAEGVTHGYGICASLHSMGVSGQPIDIGQIYRVLRNLDHDGSVASAWATEGTGPARREYHLTPAGWSALREWAAVMTERQRLSDAFLRRFAEAGTSSKKNPMTP
jgi:PadR family transcriptional regulator